MKKRMNRKYFIVVRFEKNANFEIVQKECRQTAFLESELQKKDQGRISSCDIFVIVKS